MPALSTSLLSNFPIWVLPSGALMYHISPFSRQLPCLTAWLLHFHWPVIPEKLVKFYGTPFSSCRVNLRLECLLVAKFLPLSRLRPRFINPNKHFAAILQSCSCSFTSPQSNLRLSSLALKPKWRDKDHHMVLQDRRYQTGQFVFFFICHRAGGVWPVPLAGVLD